MTATRSSNIRLRNVADVLVSNVDKRTSDDELPVQLCNYTDVYYHDRITADLSFIRASATPDEVRLFSLRAGDVLMTKDSETADDIGVPAFVPKTIPGVICGYHVAIVRPGVESVDGRYLFWTLAGSDAQGQLSARATGVTRFGLRVDVIDSIRLRYPPLAIQRAVADLLDAETARIDALIAKKGQMISLLQERLDGEIDARIWPDATSDVPLKHLTPTSRQIMYGIVLPGPDVNGGVPIVKGGDLAGGHIDAGKLCRTTHEIEARYERSRLRCGDLLFAIRGGVGDVAMVPSEASGANITQDVARVAPSDGVDGRWLMYALRSRGFQRQAQARITGATVTGINIWELKRLRVPLVAQGHQVTIADRLDQFARRTAALTAGLERQIHLLQERRQALITAAVTGEIEVPEAG